MNRRGFTMVEMLIVLGVVGILLAIAIPQYGQSMRRRGMERQIRDIQSEISSFRLSAIHRKEQYRILIGPLLLRFQRANAAVPGGWEPLPGAPVGLTGVPPAKVLSYEIQRLAGGALAQFNINTDFIQFDERGYADNFNLATIVVVPVDTGVSDGCIIVDRARNNLGRMVNANTCQAR